MATHSSILAWEISWIEVTKEWSRLSEKTILTTCTERILHVPSSFVASLRIFVFELTKKYIKLSHMKKKKHIKLCYIDVIFTYFALECSSLRQIFCLV